MQATYTYDALGRRIGTKVDDDGSGPDPAVQTWMVYDRAQVRRQHLCGFRRLGQPAHPLPLCPGGGRDTRPHELRGNNRVVPPGSSLARSGTSPTHRAP